MILLSEMPEYNRKIAAASLLAPVAYLGNSGPLLQSVSTIAPILKVNVMKNVVSNFCLLKKIIFVGC